RCGRFRRDSGSDRYRRRQGPSNSQTPQAFQFLLQVFHGVVFIHVMGFEEPVELVPGPKTQQPPQLRFGDMTALEFLQSQRFEGAPRQIATGCAHAPSDIVGNLNGEFHALLPYRAEGTQSIARPYGASSKAPFRRMSRDDAPIHTSNAPGSATQSSFAVLKNDMADLSRVNATFRACPGLSMTRWKPFNSLSGRSTLDFTSCTYNCTISAPARAPLLRTCIFTTTSLPAATLPGEIFRPL